MRHIATLGLAALAALACDMRGLVYPSPSLPVPSPPPQPVREVELTAATGERVVAWSSEGPADAPVVLFFHGNGENLATVYAAGTLDAISALGVTVVVVDYPGYGRSGGRPSEEGCVAAAEAALAWAGESLAGRPVVAFGWSLGAAVAVELAARRPEGIAGLIAASPWTSLGAVARRHYPGWLVRFALSERYDSLAAAARVRAPALVLHGASDGIVPPAQGRALADRLGAPFVLLESAGHNDLLGEPRAWQEIAAFLERYAPRAM